MTDIPILADDTISAFDVLLRLEINLVFVHVLVIVAGICDLDLGNKEAGLC